MRSSTTSGTIVWDDEFGIQYRLCRIDCTVWEDDSYEYVFTPDYHVMDMLPMERVGGIPGLDLDLRRDRYVRKSMEPVFMTERSPSRNRVDLWDLLDSVGLDHYNRLEWLIRTDLRYGGDDLYVIRYEDPPAKTFEDGMARDSVRMCRDILSALATGGRVVIAGRELDEDAGTAMGRTLRFILAADRKANPERGEIPRVGRKRKGLDDGTLYWAKECIRTNRYTAEEVAEELGVSKSTLYRRLREAGWISDHVRNHRA